jgi:hypothetical protein
MNVSIMTWYFNTFFTSNVLKNKYLPVEKIQSLRIHFIKNTVLCNLCILFLSSVAMHANDFQ